MGLSKKEFSKMHGFEIKWLSTLCKMGYVSAIKVGRKYEIDENALDFLKEKVHYVECPHCKKKMACITRVHLKRCTPESSFLLYSDLYLNRRKKTEEQKISQSKKLKERFKTPEGTLTKKIIGDASRKFNADPEFRKKKSIKSKEIQNRPENKKLRSIKSKEMWSDPVFREERMKRVENTIEELRESARKARQYLKKTSNLHIKYKKSMIERGLQGFISEYAFGPYSIDEADPFTKIAVEVDGCYWHGCQTCGFKGDSRIQIIDKRKTSYLKNRGWIIIRVKEHEIKRDPFVAIELIRNIQNKRRESFKTSLKTSFSKNTLLVRSMVNKGKEPVWVPVKDVVRHYTPHKKMIQVNTELGPARVTEDHSLFDGKTKDPIETSKVKHGDELIGLVGDSFEPVKVIETKEIDPEKYTYDLSVPQSENFVFDSGILAHNTYSVSGVSLDIEKSSKYMSIKDEFIAEYDKIVEANKRSIKIIRGLRQFRYGVGVQSALGPLSRPGIQSRRNFTEAGSVGAWS